MPSCQFANYANWIIGSFAHFDIFKKPRPTEEKMVATAAATPSAGSGRARCFREETQMGFGPHLHSLHFPLGRNPSCSGVQTFSQRKTNYFNSQNIFI
jgi:hypothetical protein